MKACFFLYNGACLLRKTEPKMGCKHRRKGDLCGLVADEVKKP